MQEKHTSQLELFSGTNISSNINSTKSSSFLSFIKGYEKTILIIICIMVTSIISFSLGVERGKQIASIKFNNSFDTALKQKLQSDARLAKQQATNLQGPISQAVPTNNQKPEVTSLAPAYTIQLASYKTRNSALKEAEGLKKKGLTPIILSKGGYSVLCVGSFSNRDSARQMLSEFKRQHNYKDCLIRRL